MKDPDFNVMMYLAENRNQGEDGTSPFFAFNCNKGADA